ALPQRLLTLLLRKAALRHRRACGALGDLRRPLGALELGFGPPALPHCEQPERQRAYGHGGEDGSQDPRPPQRPPAAGLALGHLAVALGLALVEEAHRALEREVVTRRPRRGRMPLLPPLE